MRKFFLIIIIIKGDGGDVLFDMRKAIVNFFLIWSSLEVVRGSWKSLEAIKISNTGFLAATVFPRFLAFV